MLHFSFILLKTEDLNPRYPYRKKPFDVVNQKLANRLMKFYEKFVEIKTKLEYFLILEINFAFTIPLFIEELFHVVKSGGNYLPSIRIIVCNLAVPFAGQYGILVVLISLQFMVANRIIQIKQKHMS